MRYIAKNKDRLWRFQIVQNTDAGREDPIPTAAVVHVWLSATEGGPPLDAGKVVTLVRAPTNAKTWSAVAPLADINSQIGAYPNGTKLYAVLSVVGEIDSSPVIVQSVSQIG